MKLVNGFWMPDEDTYFKTKMDKRGFQINRLYAAMEYVDNLGVAVDGGAHVGTWSIEMAKHFKAVYSFEANHDTYLCLQRNLKDKGLPSCNFSFNVALGDKHQKAKLVKDKTRIGNTGSYYIQPCDDGDINVFPLDALNLNNVGLLKLDVEGYEYHALQGAKQTILQNKPVIIIEHKDFADRYPKQECTALELLEKWGASLVQKLGKDYIYKFKD